MGWVKPTSYSDPSGSWINETYAYDGQVWTWASCAIALAYTWGGFLYLTRAGIRCNKIRYYLSHTGYPASEVDVDVLRDGVWVDVYQGPPEEGAWVEKEFTEGTVTQARVRYCSGAQPLTDGGLNEFEFWEVPPVVGYGYGDGLVSIQA